ncbi:MAG: glycosyltransferase family 2 protein [Lachnospiraceae bacterium]|nr:glycosyltransferase family 2 protein [Lachnospiraceae bacterium]
MADTRIAVLIPCYNEETTIKKVIEDFRTQFPEADIYVYDNNSSDRSVELARNAGAIVRVERLQGKGHVVRSMFLEVEANCYILVDGDDTYPAEEAHKLVKAVLEDGVDMAVGDRLSNGSYSSENKRPFHDLGNNLVLRVINHLFHSDLKDIMSGYRAYSRRFVKNFPVLSPGFEIETEMTLHALDKNWVIREEPIAYRDRPQGSVSKLNTFSDGRKVLTTIFSIYKDYQPMRFFGTLSLVVCLLGILCGLPPIIDFIDYQYVYHVPLAVLAAAIEMLAFNLLTCGIILDTISKNNKRNYRLQLLHETELAASAEKGGS